MSSGSSPDDSSDRSLLDSSTDRLHLARPKRRRGATALGEGEGDESRPVERASVEADVILIAHPDGHRLGTRYRLRSGESLEIGRAESAAVSLPEVPSISRLHARLRFVSGGVRLEDLGSTNGTFVNDRRIEGATPLRSGDRFQVGEAHFKFLHERDVETAFHEAIHEMVMRDGLTGASSKRKFQEEAGREVARARRHRRPLALVLFDVDHFKAVNDRWGHLGGDSLLKQLADRVAALMRPEQTFARVGGEEFAVLCPETAFDGAAALAEALRRRVSATPFTVGTASQLATCSFGVAELGADTASPEALFAAADAALYESKQRGRNRVSGAPARHGETGRPRAARPTPRPAPR